MTASSDAVRRQGQPAVTDVDELRLAVETQRRSLAATLAELTPEGWDTPSLCAGWTVRHVVAHLTMPYRLSGPGFALQMVRARGSFNRMADTVARKDAVRSPAQLTADVLDNCRHPWRPPGAGYAEVLTHEVVHGLDITVPLGASQPIPDPWMRTVLEVLTGAKALRHFGVDITGLRIEATDLDWSHGAGALVAGPAQELASLLCGRRLPADTLTGPGAAQLRR